MLGRRGGAELRSSSWFGAASGIHYVRHSNVCIQQCNEDIVNQDSFF